MADLSHPPVEFAVVTADNATTVSAGIDGGQPWPLTHGDNIIYTDWRKDNFYYAVQSLTRGAKGPRG